MYFETIGEIQDNEEIAVGGRIRDIMRIQRQYGHGRWRKLKGVARGFGFGAAGSVRLNCIGMKRMVSAKRK